jgi:CRISPR-associated endonuclease/helicase Cas3
MYYAHSTDDPSRSNWHPLREHLQAVADLAGRFGERFGGKKAAALAGLLHDLGKYTPEFQARLAGATDRVDHSTAGAAILAGLTRGDDRLMAELIAYGIAGHHAGLPDKTSASAGSLSERLKAFSEARLDPIWSTEIRPDCSKLVPPFRFHPEWTQFQLGFLGRMIFSCLVDADFKDTERFYAKTAGTAVDRQWPSLGVLLPDLLIAFSRHVDGLTRSDTPVNCLRSEILRHVQRRAPERPGLFTLTVPTGGGKTLTSLAFALSHAQLHGLERIIYTIPFTSIIDQTAAIFRSIFGEEVILEHHSAIDEDSGFKRPREGKDKLALAMEDWAAPIVITTNVQFFESLFAARPSRCRKLHNVARSVIILDEAQTLPRSLLAPAVRALHELAENYGCTVVLCTATQPALDSKNFAKNHPASLPLTGRELAPDPERLSRELKRVTLRHAGTLDDMTLIAALSQDPQVLVIVNSRKHALALYRQAAKAGLSSIIHLTTRQYAEHRRRILDTVRQRLRNGDNCRLIATSLVEAGVDLDFPKVWRAEAGLDQIAQAAGRCNREGRRGVDASVVSIFAAPDYPPPHEIRELCGDMSRMAHKHADLLSPAALEDYFGEVYWRLGDRLDAKAILDDFRATHAGTDFAYRTVAEKFRMIESGMVPVIVPRDKKAIDALEWLKSGNAHAGSIARALQPFIVQVPPKARARLIANGHVRFEAEQTYGDQFAVLVTEALYDTEVGLVWEDADYLALENSII